MSPLLSLPDYLHHPSPLLHSCRLTPESHTSSSDVRCGLRSSDRNKKPYSTTLPRSYLATSLSTGSATDPSFSDAPPPTSAVTPTSSSLVYNTSGGNIIGGSTAPDPPMATPPSVVKIKFSIDLKTRQAFTPEQINEVCYVDINGNKVVFDSLRNNHKVKYDGKRFSYKVYSIII